MENFRKKAESVHTQITYIFNITHILFGGSETFTHFLALSVLNRLISCGHYSSEDEKAQLRTLGVIHNGRKCMPNRHTQKHVELK